jgi:putative two-component system hydrogenase maturation factor HypX/HoxX
MRILFLTHSFNSLTQRLYCELQARGHEISIEFDIADSVAEEAVALFRPDLIIAPFLKRAIPESIWARHLCLVVHPGIVQVIVARRRWIGRSSAAVANGASLSCRPKRRWMPGQSGRRRTFALRSAKKSSIYRNEVTEASVQAVIVAVDRVLAANFSPERVSGQANPLMKQLDRAVDWERDSTASILARLNAADGYPGVADLLFGQACHLFDAWPEAILKGVPGALLGRRETAICRATVDGAIWIGHLKRPGGIKLPATWFSPKRRIYRNCHSPVIGNHRIRPGRTSLTKRLPELAS